MMRRGARPARLLAIGVSVVAVLAARRTVAVEPLLLVPNTTVVVRAAINRGTKEVCGGAGRLVFSVRNKALLATPGLHEAGAILDGVAIGGATDISLSAGPHLLTFSGSTLPNPASTRTLELSVRDAGNGQPQNQSITLQGDVVNRSMLPVGRIFLEGIDLMMGHLVMTTADLKVPGRHLSLDVSRTYAGSMGAPDGPVGARWTFTHESRLTPIEECGLYVVTVSGGSSQTFETVDHGRTFVPERGYHTTLTRLPDGSFDFTDKSANRYHFGGPDPSGERTRRLLYLEEPHGDRLGYRYDPKGRLIEVAESQVVSSTVRLVARTLRLGWSRAGDFDRIQSIDAVGLGLHVEYGYDTWGNLTTATRHDTDLSDPTIERMAYSVDLAADRHRLLSLQEADGRKLEYRFSGQGQVQEVIERPRKGGMVSTTFKFEKLPSPLTPFRTTTRLSALPVQIYDLNEGGRSVRTEITDEAGRLIETVTWAPDDVLKVSQTDNRGNETRYAYDARGNLIRETTTNRQRAQPQVVTSEYDPRFNLLLRQVDAKGGVSTWSLDPRTGDLLESRDAKGMVEKYRYDSYGRTVEAETAAGKSVVLEHNTFGSAVRIRLPSGKIETHEYDPRGRRYSDDPVPPVK